MIGFCQALLKILQNFVRHCLFLGERIQPCFFGIGLGAGWSDSFGLAASRGASQSNFVGRKTLYFLDVLCLTLETSKQIHERKTSCLI